VASDHQSTKNSQEKEENFFSENSNNSSSPLPEKMELTTVHESGGEICQKLLYHQVGVHKQTYHHQKFQKTIVMKTGVVGGLKNLLDLK